MKLEHLEIRTDWYLNVKAPTYKVPIFEKLSTPIY